jgi:hypothetical protein
MLLHLWSWASFSLQVLNFIKIFYAKKKINCSCRYDWSANKSLCAGYFPWAMLAYGLGMELSNQSPFSIGTTKLHLKMKG